MHEKYLLLEESNSSDSRENYLREKTDLMLQIDRLTQELSMSKTKLLEQRVQKKTEETTRYALFSSYRIETRDGRLRFIGKPRIFGEILMIIGRLEKSEFESTRE